jgi:lysophospholipase L1-like esterase
LNRNPFVREEPVTNSTLSKVLWAAILPVVLAGPAAAEPFELKDGDRVVLIGSTLIERDQSHGYLEAALTARFPDRNITFRNLGWSGDTVFGHARARFGTVADGFTHLRDHVAALNPTVLIVGYGMAESFDGDAGLPAFAKGLDTMLDATTRSKPRLVFLGPNRHEDLGRPLPDPTEHNRQLRRYADAIRDTAGRRGGAFVDLFELLGKEFSSARPLTDNGIHLTDFGYRRFAAVTVGALGVAPPTRVIELSAADGKAGTVTAATVTKIEAGGGGLRFVVRDATLPTPDAERIVRVRGLAAGRHTLRIDGKVAATATAEQWAAGVHVARGPEFEQFEALRKRINAKNVIYFNRWRPQNETYLFGFRKHEQGRNAAEIPRFDPLVAEAEKQIAKLRVPVEHVYEVVRE